MKSVGLLPGTFDPIHKAHIQLAEAARSAFGFDAVWLLVNPRRPLGASQNGHKAAAAGWRHRLAMTELAAEQVDGLMAYRGYGYDLPHSMGSFEQLMGAHGGVRFRFILGADAIASLDRWEQPAQVVRGATFAVAGRQHDAAGVVHELRSRLGAMGPELDAQLIDFDGFKAVSSSAIRAGLAHGVQPGALDDAVYDYILATGLYRG